MTSLREKLKGAHDKPSIIKENEEKLALAARFMGPPPSSMKEFAEFTRKIFGVPLHLMILDVSRKDYRHQKFVPIKFCTLEKTIEFMDNPFIKQWHDNYGIRWPILCELAMKTAFGGEIIEFHIQNYIVGKTLITVPERDYLEEDELILRLKNLLQDHRSTAHQNYIKDQLIKRGEIT